MTNNKVASLVNLKNADYVKVQFSDILNAQLSDVDFRKDFGVRTVQM